ncbi:hypothetical protein [Dysgonomonas sp. 520]|uniref:hypothetical protein n=1 Tax=Dysgonomonas sp. 520 TaxID=2302931 RepID=UPI0013D534B2|nr:hypothetical protein [Dysgonomonas sp. 520]NDW08672.1 hypothetical protein [Dysgonomonas sp. 520]
MKKILNLIPICLIAILLASCVSTTFTYQKIVSIDYSKYNTEGFFITESNCVNFDYTAISSVIVRNNYFTDPNIIFEELINECKKQGADGIINLNFYLSSDNKGEEGDYIIKGMAIKRK